MKNYFTILDDILYKGMRPWLEVNNPDERFASMISGVKQVGPTFQPKYEIQFERPFNNKTKYYSKLILNEKIKSTNFLLVALQEDDTPLLIKYRLDAILNRKLKSKIKDIGNIIKKRQFDISYINPRKTTFDIDQEHKTNTYIFQLLKISLIHIYLEIQEVFKDWIQDKFVIEDFYSQWLFEPIPSKFYIHKIQVIEADVPKPVGHKSDDRFEDIPFASFTYIGLQKNPEYVNDLCDSLKKFSFIDQKTTVTNFKKVFSGNPVSVPVIWTGNPTEFSYLIKLIHNKHKLVVDLKQKQWKVACKCFVQSDGTPFDRAKLRTLKKPQLSYKQLESAVNKLK